MALGVRPAEQVRDHVHGERCREIGDEVHPLLDLVAVEQLVDARLDPAAQVADPARAESGRNEASQARVIGAFGLEQVDADVAVVVRQPAPARVASPPLELRRRAHMIHGAAEPRVEHQAADVPVAREHRHPDPRRSEDRAFVAQPRVGGIRVRDERRVVGPEIDFGRGAHALGTTPGRRPVQGLSRSSTGASSVLPAFISSNVRPASSWGNTIQASVWCR